jgi:lipid II:glycine glycyltransferase (peptidoglycan interpeptide bridge formation enzyme)
MILDLTPDEDRLLASCERIWRRNLRRSEKCHLTTRQWKDPDVNQILLVFLSMQNLKALPEQHSRREIEQLIKNLKEHFVLYRCDDEHGELVSLGGFLVFGSRASAWFAATTERGRKLHASYAIFWALVQHCRTIGVKSYDLAGIDPVLNPGVYRFKRGTGATPVELLGEWDWASRPWLRWFGNWAIAQRSRIKQAETALSKSKVIADQAESSPPECAGDTSPRTELAAQSL